MRISTLFTKTKKDAKEFESVNATYLTKGGFIEQTMAGVYNYLPLGLKVLSKIEHIVREEMNKIGQEIMMSALSPTSLWEQTKRLETVDVLYKVEGANKASRLRNDSIYILNATHEEIATSIMQKFAQSYRDLPTSIYQIQTKFRNEARPKSGLLRGREFRMKDMYSFHTTPQEFQQYYEKSKEVYMNVYNRLGLGDITHLTLASGGDFTNELSHEFQTECETGEDLIFHVESKKLYFNKEVAPSKVPQEYDNTENEKPIQKIKTVGITGVTALAKFLELPIEKCIKTMIYETDKGVVAAAVRGDYEINEIKLKRHLGASYVNLATDEIVTKVTGAKVGYAGILNLPADVTVVLDDSLDGLKNFECGGNETDMHIINVNFGRDLPAPKSFVDIKEIKVGDLYPETGEEYKIFKASEVGNIFTLETKYSDALGYKYTDIDGTEKPVYMGCYGLGTTRVMGVLVEVFHDNKGIIWPESVAPYKVHLVALNQDNANIKTRAEELYKQLKANNIEVLFDDRLNVSAGEKFADADLIGCPYRVVISQKAGDNYEIKKRNEESAQTVDLDTLLKMLF